MSKHSLQKAASERSGVTFEESTEATSMKPSLYERIGVEGIRELSTRFYDKVFEDKEAFWFLNIFSSSTRSEAITNQYLFFVQTLEGLLCTRTKRVNTRASLADTLITILVRVQRIDGCSTWYKPYKSTLSWPRTWKQNKS